MATRFKEVMDAHLISAKRLSELTGDSENSIRAARSRDISTTSILIKYARAMNVPLWEFFLQPANVTTYTENLYDGIDEMYIANLLLAQLKERKMPKAKLAELIDRHPTFVGRIFKEGNVTISTLDMICKALGIEVWELFISREEKDRVCNINNVGIAPEPPAMAPAHSAKAGRYVAVPLLPNGSPDLSKLEWIDTPEGRVLAWAMSEVRIIDVPSEGVDDAAEDEDTLLLTGDR